MAYAIGHISGCHLNPAVTLGLWAGRRFPAKDVPYYLIAQVLGGIVGAAVLWLIASGKAGFKLSGGLAANGYGAHSPGHYTLLACLVAELVLSFGFLDRHSGRHATGGRPRAWRRWPSAWPSP